jgi:F-type H+-transporting ATPase subunit b
MELLKLLNPTELAVQLISFLILFFLLKKYLWTNFMAFLDQRRDKIADDVKSIEDAKKDIAKIKTDYEAKISEIEKLSRERVQAGIEQGRKDAEQIKVKAQEEAQKIISKAQETISYEVAKAKEDLKNDIVGLAMSAAELVVKEKVNPEKDRKLIEDFIREVDKEE